MASGREEHLDKAAHMRHTTIVPLRLAVTPPLPSQGSPDKNLESQSDHPSPTREKRKIDISSLEERETISTAKWVKITHTLLTASKILFEFYDLVKLFFHRH